MKQSRTTLWGAVGGAATAIQAVPDLASWLRITAIVVAAMAFGGLGYHATDCPAMCPGTDAQGRRLGAGPSTFIAGLLVLLGLAAAVIVVSCCTGCTALVARSYVKSGSGTNQVHKGGTLYGVTFFDSGQVLGKTKVSYEAATNGTWPPEISTAGVTQQATSTGLVTIIQNFPKMVPVP